MDNEKKIEMPFGAFDSELVHQEINIPKGFKVTIEGDKIILTRAERGDEKVRKALAEMVHDTTGDELWVDYNVHKEEALAWLEKQGEQKPANKVEPKFKVGDWIINNEHNNVAKVLEINNEQYRLDYFDTVGTISIALIDNDYHFWTIQDAKDGDVLCSNQIIVLFKQWEDNTDYSFVIAHAGIDISGKLQITNGHWLISNKSKPATKEQCDLLFQKMHEAGYEWDAEKKELKKIEQNPAEVEPKFKVGDKIIKFSKTPCPVHDSTDDTVCEVVEVQDACYILNTKEGKIQEPFEWQDYYKFVEPKTTWGERMKRNLKITFLPISALITSILKEQNTML